jgi:hypothetical protein
VTFQQRHPHLDRAGTPIRAAGLGFLYLARLDAEWQARRRTAAFPLFRWAAALGLVIWCAAGSNPASMTAWATHHGPWLILAGALAFGPEVASIRFGGFRLDTITEDVRELRGKVEQLQIAQASSSSASEANVKTDVNITVQANQAGEVAIAKKGVQPASALGRYIGGGTGG